MCVCLSVCLFCSLYYVCKNAQFGYLAKCLISDARFMPMSDFFVNLRGMDGGKGRNNPNVYNNNVAFMHLKHFFYIRSTTFATYQLSGFVIKAMTIICLFDLLF